MLIYFLYNSYIYLWLQKLYDQPPKYEYIWWVIWIILSTYMFNIWNYLGRMNNLKPLIGYFILIKCFYGFWILNILLIK